MKTKQLSTNTILGLLAVYHLINIIRTDPNDKNKKLSFEEEIESYFSKCRNTKIETLSHAQDLADNLIEYCELNDIRSTVLLQSGLETYGQSDRGDVAFASMVTSDDDIYDFNNLPDDE